MMDRNSEQSQLLLEEIRKNFPKPCKVDENANGYCVGGALCLVLRRMGKLSIWQNFPNETMLAGALRVANPVLPADKAHSYACSIIFHNDARRFSNAWRLLRAALGEQG